MSTPLRIRILLICLICSAASSAAAENYAFLVGVSDYDTKQLKPLAYARADVMAFRDVLLEAGLEAENVVLMHDDGTTLPHLRYAAEAGKIRRQLQLLITGLTPDDSLIVALAGHGVQFRGEDEHYFCPLDVDLGDPDRESLISLTELYAQLERCTARQKLLLVDACRNDPQTNLARTTGLPELESVTLPQLAEPPEGVVALFSCAAGQQAFEHPDLEHGVFFYHVLEAFRGEADDGDRQLTLDELLAFTKSRTTRFSRVELDAAQTPRQRGFFDGEWILREIAQRLLVAPFSEVEAREAQRETAEYLRVEAVETNSIGMKLALIPAGEFLMGGDQSAEDVARLGSGQPSWYEHEHPQHRVRITRPFFMGAFEVTQAQWESVMGTNPSAFSSLGLYSIRVDGMDTSAFPVESITWYDAVEFCNTLSLREGLSPCYSISEIERTDGSIRNATVSVTDGNGYRLPTEAEWEYACRAGTESPFHFGMISTLREANVVSSYASTPQAPRLDRTTTVGSYAANAFGLYDMHGNVYEWCFDAYDADDYAERAGKTLDPVIVSSERDLRVLRGGSFVGGYRSANRFKSAPKVRNVYGLRVTRTP